jgi:hypothetical protein
MMKLGSMSGFLRGVGVAAHAAASALSPEERVALVADCGVEWDELMPLTAWFDGVYDTRDGMRMAGSWSELAAMFTDYATNIIAKGDGMWVTPALSSNGRCRDGDIEAITAVAFDADVVGDWHSMREMLARAGIASIFARSSSHQPDRPKWHVLAPLALWWSGSKTEWRQIYRHCAAWFSAAAGLASDFQAVPPRFGFDCAVDRLGQPWFLGARRSSDQPPPEVICSRGRALDLERFLQRTGFDPSKLPPATDRRSRERRPRSPHLADSETPGNSLLERAFAAAGWLGPQLGSDRRAVRCPWHELHTVGFLYDGSTILFPPTTRANQGWFHCSHAHCSDREQSAVFRALPPAAVLQALSELRSENARYWRGHNANRDRTGQES